MPDSDTTPQSEQSGPGLRVGAQAPAGGRQAAQAIGVSAPKGGARVGRAQPGDPLLEARLASALEGEVLFDPFDRGRYATDASHYQIEPIGVVVPRTTDDVIRAIQIAGEEGVAVLPRGGGTSQCGQTVGRALVIDASKHLDAVLDFDPQARRVTVEPGLVLDRLNAFLRPHGLFFPVDPSTSSRATLGGMAANNSCGARSIRYGIMRDSVRAVDGLLADGSRLRFDAAGAALSPDHQDMIEVLRALGEREAAEIAARFPKLMRRVGGYNIDALAGEAPNLGHLLVGSEGTLAFFAALELDLQPIPPHRVLGVCHFSSFYEAMDATRHIVALGPAAVEVVDRTLIDLARDNPLYRDAVAEVVRGHPDALLLVEFAGDDHAAEAAKLGRLSELLADLGWPGAVVEVIDPAVQRAVWEVRKAGLNIVMSMKGEGKPVSFIEDCAVGLDDLADYTRRLDEIFQKHGTKGTWYAHASVGCLHVRPILNLKQETEVAKMRAIAEETFEIVREYKGSHSGEHGDGLVRSEFHEAMFGPRMVQAFEAVKDTLDPQGLFNPGKIVHAPKMDDRSLLRFKPGYRAVPVATALDWSAWGGFAGAVEMCNNNGACRKFDAGVMCPSYRATRNERDLTRGRANSLRLALSGQLGPDALASPEMAESLKLCVGCKGCKRECPTGVDMARMKIEVLYHQTARRPLGLRDRTIANLPRVAPWGARLAPLLNLRDRLPGLPWLGERLLGLSAKRALPAWRRDPFSAAEAEGRDEGEAGRVVLLPDTFNAAFEPENLRAALRVLRAAGYGVTVPGPQDGTDRPLCCGRTYLAAGLVEEAREEMRRTVEALAPLVRQGLPVIGLEPACLFTLRDEFLAVLPGVQTERLAESAVTFEEFLSRERNEGRLRLDLNPTDGGKALLHGHCHQKAFAAMSPVEQVLGLVPGLEVETVESSCCGMAGAFGYAAETYDVSLRMAELSLLPAVRAADPDTLVVADGVSCRQQIAHGAGRPALHCARVLERALAPGTG
jgi:FAD/FMN-containing dehydrogenase/Fe-S oxidoreductase